VDGGGAVSPLRQNIAAPPSARRVKSLSLARRMYRPREQGGGREAVPLGAAAVDVETALPALARRGE
jgi:hypothetical protein